MRPQIGYGTVGLCERAEQMDRLCDVALTFSRDCNRGVDHRLRVGVEWQCRSIAAIHDGTHTILQSYHRLSIQATSWSRRSRPAERSGSVLVLLYLANAMVDQHIGLEETDDGLWTIS
jgi:hypothetical protein